MNGISSFNYRPVTPEKERRMMVLLYAFFLGFGAVGAVTYPVWSYLQHMPMTLDGWIVVALLTVMAAISARELVKEVRKKLLPSITTSAGIVSLSFQFPSVVGNVLEVTIEPLPGCPAPNVLFVTDNAGNTYTQASPTAWRSINGKSTPITVTVSFTKSARATFDIKLKEWGAPNE